MQFVYFAVAIIIVISIHEFSHAWAANRLGDPTAKFQGRMTLNPLAHLDPIGTIMLFLIGIGWGKPVPINPMNFKNPMKDSALVSFAGPGSNLLTAVILSFPLKHFGLNLPEPLSMILWGIFDLSILLAVFNLIPIPPLDGSKLLGLIIPKSKYMVYNKFLRGGVKYFILLILLDSFFLSRIFGVSILVLTIGTLFNLVKSGILLGT